MLLGFLLLAGSIIVLSLVYALLKLRLSSAPAHFERIAHTLPFPVLVWEVNTADLPLTRLLHANRAARGMFSIGKKSLVVGATWKQLDTPDEDTAHVLRALVENKQHTYIHEWIGKTWKAYCVPLNHGTPRVSVVYVDITAEAEALAAAQRTNQDLEQFAYHASHDLQEPLRMIGSWTASLFEDYGDRLQDYEALKMKEYVLGGVTRMQALIRDLLRFSRAGRDLKLAKLELAVSLSEAFELLQVQIRENSVAIEIDEMPLVIGDYNMLVLVFQNLISNAIKFRRAGMEFRPRIQVTAQTLPGNRYTEICVRDNGIGIDPKYQTKVFEVFTRLYTQEEYSGTGIGLALVRRVVNAHGGSVRVESAGHNKGTAVFFTLPLA